MNRLSPRRLFVLLRHIAPLDRVALVVILLYVAVRVFAAFVAPVRFSGFIAFLGFLAAVYLVVRLVPWFRTKFMWTLRNRLIVVYVFIAVVPVILLLSMVGLAAYGLYLQLGAHIFHDDLQARISTISADADALAGAVEQEAAQGASPTSEAILARPGVANLIEAARREWPDLRVFPNRGERLVQAGDGRHFAGLVEFGGKIWVSAAVEKTGPAGPFYLVVGTPLNPAFLDGLPSDIGPIQIIPLRPTNQQTPAGASLSFNGKVFVPGEQIASRGRVLESPANWFDVRIGGVSTIDLAHIGPQPDDAPAAVLATFAMRASALNRRLFTSVGEIGPLLELALIAAGVIFLALEFAALITGIVLTRTITRAVGDLYEATLNVRRGDFAQRIRVHQRDQLGALGESFNEMTSSISELIVEQGKRQKLENEIAIAREVQSQLFPQVLPALPGLELAAICRPARVVSGDYYDFIRTGQDCVGIALADISGKGIFAALLMASLQAALRSQASLDGNCTTADLVSRLNRHVFRNTSDDRYATFFYAVFDVNTRMLTYTNAGHLSPFFVCRDEVQELSEGGTVIGMFEDISYTQGSIKVEPGSLLVAFSDGLTEPENVYGEEFGMHRLKEEILRQRSMPPQRIAENLIAAAEQWAGTPEQADDITVVIARMG
ncbi:MAG TPA: SpoIIE family protein phosphatase [Candidatus Acidoferrales bacterium]|nr:SpoIIE family protein phosphatase [Candidatus Acidoferrales bacterium]